MRRFKRLASTVLATAFALPCVAALAAPGGLDLSYAQPQVDCNPRLIAADNGGMFAVCSDRIVDPRNNTLGRQDIKVYKFTPNGSPDPAWGTLGKAMHSISRLLPFGACGGTDCTLLLRDGGILVVLEDSEAARFDVRGHMVPDFAKPEGFRITPVSEGRSETRGWGIARIIEAPNGEFRVIAHESKPAELRDQLIAVRRYSGVGVFLDETIYRADLSAFDSESGVRTADIAPIVLGFRSGNLQIAQPTESRDRLVQVELTPGGGQTVAPSLDLGGFRDPNAIRVSQSPDGRLAMPWSYDRLSEWTPAGRPNFAFGDRGVSAPPKLEDGWCMDLFGIHANGRYSIRMRSEKIFRGATCVTAYGALVQGGSGAISPLFAFAASDTAMDVGGNYYHAMQMGAGTPVQLIRSEGFGPVSRVNVVEYYTPVRDRYFMTAIPKEIEFVDQLVSEGWKRTGRTFYAWNIETLMSGTLPVCRFYALDEARNGTYFQSAEEPECGGLRSLELSVPAGQAGWRFDKNAFRITLPVNGQCSNGLSPVVRFNNGQTGPVGLPNYRYVTRQQDIDDMTAKGWINEGVRMCAVL